MENEAISSMSKPIYLDYNATTPIAPEVVAEMQPWFDTNFGNPSSAYAIGRSSKEAIDKARKQVASLINAELEEIIFTSCATEQITWPFMVLYLPIMLEESTSLLRLSNTLPLSKCANT